ncbi:hypothetical protein M758_5G116300 [Ceratodon purpureus]|nr:hypothetical protein M758_5G116300 [Ceratodon purpureus]
METFPWEPPDEESGGKFVMSRSVWGGVDEVDDGAAASSSDESRVFCRQVGGHGLETPGREGDAHGPGSFASSGLEVEVVGSQEVQLDLGLTDITKYFSYSKLWRTLYFVNDAPFCIHHHRIHTVQEWTGPLGLVT